MSIPNELFILVPLAFVTGIINAAVGGGGLIQVPGLFATLPLATPAQIMGTDKLSAIMGHAASMRQYALRMALPWRLLLWTSLAAFVGAYGGVRIMYLVPAQWMRPVVIVVLAAMLAYTWFRPQFGIHDGKREITRQDLGKGLALGAVIGFYDGFIGPGTGSFLLFLFVRIFHFDFLRATACAKVVNFGTNLAALAFLIPAGMVFYHYAIPMCVASILGALIGTRAAMKAGNQWIRRLFLVLALGLLCKLVWETLRAWV
ncbi:sulfite exporter TauE/SafE family protein [Uliginosibacterium gangwonense]|uniref:sulfite exporter TauE/SafE family protein n=1 Tax=Uliginosibacterium gangwonense TaxID=392736 RepID=UPI00035CA720|nr:TSUP family transporter [Uliginosibacterium gangwonense]